MKDFIKLITSRKFLLAVGATITFVANKDYIAAVTVILGYFSVNLGSEIVANKK